MEKMIFLDTNFLIAYYNKNDAHHDKSLSIMESLVSGEYGELFISDYIFDEFVTVALSRLKDLAKVINIGNDVEFFTHRINIEEETFEKAWEIFREQKDTEFSFTDCTILALMKEEGIKYIATFDIDFKKIKDINIIG